MPIARRRKLTLTSFPTATGAVAICVGGPTHDGNNRRTIPKMGPIGRSHERTPTPANANFAQMATHYSRKFSAEASTRVLIRKSLQRSASVLTEALVIWSYLDESIGDFKVGAAPHFH
jgi:hypothetical protein